MLMAVMRFTATESSWGSAETWQEKCHPERSRCVRLRTWRRSRRTP